MGDTVLETPGESTDQATGILNLLDDFSGRCPQCINDHAAFGSSQRLIHQCLSLNGRETETDLIILLGPFRNASIG